MSIVTRGFTGRRREPDKADRIPPGQYATDDFPVLSAGPTPRGTLSAWDFQIRGVALTHRWTWNEFLKLPRVDVTADIHCVTKWSKLDTHWSGVSVDTLLADTSPQGEFVTIFADGGYTTNLLLADIVEGKAWVVDRFERAPLAPEHGGPARLLVPHLYLWKSAKWVRGIEITEKEHLGFWEQAGYHERGDPWKEQRYRGD